MRFIADEQKFGQAALAQFIAVDRENLKQMNLSPYEPQAAIGRSGHSVQINRGRWGGCSALESVAALLRCSHAGCSRILQRNPNFCLASADFLTQGR
jgi:hypothetical protein